MKINVEIDTSRCKIDTNSVEKAISRELEDTAHKIERTAKEIVPVDTGALRASINTSGGPLDYEIIARTEYAKYIEDGTAPHVITGNFYLILGEQEKLVHSVNHPGNRAYKYMENACDTQIEGIEDRIAEAISKYL